MKNTILIATALLLFTAAAIALKTIAPDIDYWGRLFILLAAYFSGVVAKGIDP